MTIYMVYSGYVDNVCNDNDQTNERAFTSLEDANKYARYLAKEMSNGAELTEEIYEDGRICIDYIGSDAYDINYFVSVEFVELFDTYME